MTDLLIPMENITWKVFSKKASYKISQTVHPSKTQTRAILQTKLFLGNTYDITNPSPYTHAQHLSMVSFVISRTAGTNDFKCLYTDIITFACVGETNSPIRTCYGMNKMLKAFIINCLSQKEANPLYFTTLEQNCFIPFINKLRNQHNNEKR